jgi:hypothetical protein
MFMSRFRRIVAATILFLAVASQARAGFILDPFAVPIPSGRGDQVIFYFDARDGFTTYINVRNADPVFELQVRILFYTGGFSVPFVRELTLGARALEIVDVGGLRDEGLPAQVGVAIAFAVNDEGSAVVTRSLTGNFTVGNLSTLSAWGAAGAARNAIFSPVVKKTSAPAGTEQPSGILFVIPPRGTVIDGFDVFLQPIQPDELELATYYNPDDLGPVADGGNQLIFVSFVDLPGPSYAAAPSSVLWQLEANSTDGTPITETTFGASGVTVTDLASVLGAGVNGASGSVRFSAGLQDEPVNRLVYFAEALETFGTGYLLPAPLVPPDPAE